MSEENKIPVATDPAVLEEREKNQKIVEAYLAVKGSAAMEERLALVADDVMYEIVNTMECYPERVCGSTNLRRRFEINAKCWGEFEYNNIKIFPAQDPGIFLVECDADGTMTNPMFTVPRPYHNYYFIMFCIREGKIWKLRQFSNPMKLIHDFWCQQPDMCK